MVDATWKLFCQTGNIEAYLLLKELESDPDENNLIQADLEHPVPLETES